MLFCGFQIYSSSWNDGIAFSENHGIIKYGIAQGFFLAHGLVVFVIKNKKVQKHDTISLKMQNHPHWEVHVRTPPPSCPIVAIPLSCKRSPRLYISFSDVKEYIYLAVIVNLYEKD